MAHEVQAGSVRIKVRAPWQVLVFGIFTLGIHTLYWWVTTARQMESFHREHGAGGAGAPAGGAIIAGCLAMGSLWVANAAGFYAGFRAATDAAAGLPPGTTSGSAATMANVLIGVCFLTTLVGAGLLRRNAMVTASTAGLLPEERAPSGWVHWVATVLLFRALGPITPAVSVQTTLNAAWERYPRYFASLGGTREQVAADATVATPVGGSTPTHAAAATPAHAPASAPALRTTVSAAPTPVTGIAVPPAASIQQAAAVPAPQPQLSPAAQHMLALEPAAQAGALTPAQAYEYAQAAEQVHGPEAAAPWYAFVLQVDPSNVFAAYWYGVFQLTRADDAGITTLHGAMGDVRTDSHARSQVVAYLTARGRHEEAARYAPPAAAAAA